MTEGKPKKPPRVPMAPGTVPCPTIVVYETVDDVSPEHSHLAFFLAAGRLQAIYLPGESASEARAAARQWWQAEQDKEKRHAELAQERSDRMKRRHGENRIEKAAVERA